MKIVEAFSGSVLAFGGIAGSLFALSGDIGLLQILLVLLGGTGGVGGVWLMTRAIFARQEARIVLLEQQNAQLQRALDVMHEEHGNCRISLARMEEQIAILRCELERQKTKNP